MNKALKTDETNQSNVSDVKSYDSYTTISVIDTIDFEKGHMMPNSWFHHVCLKNGRADTIAVFILSEIVGFYKRLPSTNVIDFLNPVQSPRVYKACIQTFIDIFELTPQQINRALDSLEGNGFILRQFEEPRKPQKKYGKIDVAAQFFVMPVADAIKKITYVRQ